MDKKKQVCSFCLDGEYFDHSNNKMANIHKTKRSLTVISLSNTQRVLKLWLDSQCISLQMGIYSINFIMFLRVVMRQCVHWLNRRVAPEIPSRNHSCLSKRFAGSGHDTVPRGHKQWPGSPNQISLRIFRAKYDSKWERALFGALFQNFPHLVKVIHKSSGWVIRQCLTMTQDSDQDTTAANDSTDSSARVLGLKQC